MNINERLCQRSPKEVVAHRGVLIFLGRIRVMKKGVEETCIDIQSESREWSLAHSDGLTLNHWFPSLPYPHSSTPSPHGDKGCLLVRAGRFVTGHLKTKDVSKRRRATCFPEGRCRGLGGPTEGLLSCWPRSGWWHKSSFPQMWIDSMTLQRTYVHSLKKSSLVPNSFKKKKKDYPHPPLFCSLWYMETPGLFLARDEGMLVSSEASAADYS